MHPMFAHSFNFPAPLPTVLLEFQFCRFFPSHDEISKSVHPLYLLEIVLLLFVIVFFKLRSCSTYLSVVSKQRTRETNTHTHPPTQKQTGRQR